MYTGSSLSALEVRLATLLVIVIVLMLVAATLLLLLLVLRLAPLVLLLLGFPLILLLGLALLLLLGLLLLLLLLRLSLRSTTVVRALLSRLVGVLSLLLGLLNEGFEVHLLVIIILIIAIIGKNVINIFFIFREILLVII